MKSIKKITALIACALLIFSFAACNNGQSEPVQLNKVTGLIITDNSLTWDAVPNAQGYTVNVSGKKVTVKTNSFDLSAFEVKETVIRVMANGDEQNYLSSQWSNRIVYDPSNYKNTDPRFSFTLNSDLSSYTISAGEEKPTGVLQIPSTFNNRPVTVIARNSFTDCEITKLIIPETIKVIERYAFARCLLLESIQIKGNALTEIGEYAFSFNRALKLLNIPQSVAVIGEYMVGTNDKEPTLTIYIGAAEVQEGWHETALDGFNKPVETVFGVENFDEAFENYEKDNDSEADSETENQQ
ncbi:MAG: leucine-rich repeat protein [Clostridia bacterium]|nr:leucine-rich repeat protein [Clostridia bacterium]